MVVENPEVFSNTVLASLNSLLKISYNQLTLQKVGDNLEDLGVGGRISLRWTLGR
jgi:hypothetical protein